MQPYSASASISRRSFVSRSAMAAAACAVGGRLCAEPPASPWTMRLSTSSIHYLSLPIEQACQRIANLDTGNSWLGGPTRWKWLEFFKDKIHHVHGKDLSAEWEPRRGTEYGCGFSTIALGDGVIDIKGVCDVLRDAPIEHSTLEIVGSEERLHCVLVSFSRSTRSAKARSHSFPT
jgi:hypothetical protein